MLDAAAHAEVAPLVSVRAIDAGYGNVKVLRSVTFDIRSGEFLGVIGHNGAGKSTLMKAIAGLLPVEAGRIERHPIGDRPPRVAMVPEGLAVFPRMTVRENLEIPRITAGSRADLVALGEIFDLFPGLEGRMAQPAGTMSGGEQRMLAVGMALRLAPDLLLLDEPSLGLAPNLVVRIMDAVGEARQRFGSTVVIVEQNLDALMRRAGRLIAIRQGQHVWTGTPDSLSDTRDLWEFF